MVNDTRVHFTEMQEIAGSEDPRDFGGPSLGQLLRFKSYQRYQFSHKGYHRGGKRRSQNSLSVGIIQMPPNTVERTYSNQGTVATAEATSSIGLKLVNNVTLRMSGQKSHVLVAKAKD